MSMLLGHSDMGYHSGVKVREGLFGGRRGLLALSRGRLTLFLEQTECFEIEVREIRDWNWHGTGVDCEVNGRRYRLSFEVGLGLDGGIPRDLNAKQLCREWREVIASETSRRGPADGTGDDGGAGADRQ